MIFAEIEGSGIAIRNLEAATAKARAALADAVSKQVMYVARAAKKKASGQALKNRTGTLRRKITTRLDLDAAKGMWGLAGIKLHYAPIHEFGFNGIEQVKAHLRRTKWGLSQVKAHARAMYMPERSFLRAALEERRPAIKKALEAAMAMAGGQ